MPRKKVRFAAQARPPRDDERSVLDHFSCHLNRCQECHLHFDLCGQGKGLASDLRGYLEWTRRHMCVSRIEQSWRDVVEVDIPQQYNLASAYLRSRRLARERHNVVETYHSRDKTFSAMIEFPAYKVPVTIVRQ